MEPFRKIIHSVIYLIYSLIKENSVSLYPQRYLNLILLIKIIYEKSFLFAMMLCCAQLLSAQQERIDLSGTWRFQADPMGFGKTPGSELYQAKLTESIMLPGSTDEGGKVC